MAPWLSLRTHRVPRQKLLTAEELPCEFFYPGEFLRVAGLELAELEPWWIFGGSPLRQRFAGLAERYPQRRLVPFARREDCDDVACWDLDAGDVVVIHDFARPGWEGRSGERYPDFEAWLRAAIGGPLPREGGL